MSLLHSHLVCLGCQVNVLCELCVHVIGNVVRRFEVVTKWVLLDMS